MREGAGRQSLLPGYCCDRTIERRRPELAVGKTGPPRASEGIRASSAAERPRDATCGGFAAAKCRRLRGGLRTSYRERPVADIRSRRARDEQVAERIEEGFGVVAGERRAG